MALLVVENLAVGRGGVRLLEGLDFSVEAGGTLVLKGPNGIGKTTLLRTLAGLQPPAGGKVRLAEEDAVFAGHADGVKATLSVAENLAFWAGVFGTGGVGEAMERFRLGALRDRPARELSAGQRRRLGLARLLVTARKLWLLDEPTVSLDTDSVALFEAALAAHLAAGGGALIASHLPIGGGTELDLSPFRAALPADAGSEWAL